jgi:hypothetical protein
MGYSELQELYQRAQKADLSNWPHRTPSQEFRWSYNSPPVYMCPYKFPKDFICELPEGVSCVRCAIFQEKYQKLQVDWHSISKLQNEKESEPMKTLFHVIVVTTKEVVLVDEKVVGSDADEAKFLAGVYAAIREAKLLPKDVTIICNMLGQVKVEKEPEKVKIVKEA